MGGYKTVFIDEKKGESMKKFFIFLLIVLVVVLSLFAVFYFRDSAKVIRIENLSSNEEDQIAELKAYLSLENKPIQWTDVQSTADLEKLFEGVKFDKIPQIFVRRFPDDFSQNGYPLLLAKTLLPHILRQNQLLSLLKVVAVAL